MTNKKFNKLNLIYEKVEKLKPNPKCPKVHPRAQINDLKISILEYGIVLPILIDENKQIISGHAIFTAAQELGFTEVPIMSVEYLNKAQKCALTIALNKMSEKSTWNVEFLKESYDFLVKENFDIRKTGFEVGELEFLILDQVTDEESESDPTDGLPDENEIPRRVNVGDLFALGNHRLLCGDARKQESYEILLGEHRAQMILADFPFNVPISGHVCGNGKIKHREFKMASGEMSSEEFIEFLKMAMSNLIKYSTDNSLHYIFADWRHVLEFATAGKLYTEFKNICIWNKLVGGQGSGYRSQYEMIFLYKNGKNKHINNIQLGKFGNYRTNVWDFKGVHVSNPENKDDLRFHPTCKPVKMLCSAILDSSNPNDIILDNFSGSGSLILACEKTHRKGYTIEIDELYCDTAIYRWEQLTGKKAKLIKNYKEVNHG